MAFNIAIDGPAGAGKSTIAKTLAKELEFTYVDTGAMYRAIALYFLNQGYDVDVPADLEGHIDEIDIVIKYVDGAQRVILNGDDVSTDIRQEIVGNSASKVSAYGFVRAKLLSLQRDMAANYNVIMDGRDIGTCVLPDAQLKIYLTASVATRALRRYNELTAKGEQCDLKDIEADIEERDYRDMHRDIAPLKQADDAVLVDSSEMNIDEVVAAIRELYKKAADI